MARLGHELINSAHCALAGTLAPSMRVGLDGALASQARER